MSGAAASSGAAAPAAPSGAAAPAAPARWPLVGRLSAARGAPGAKARPGPHEKLLQSALWEETGKHPDLWEDRLLSGAAWNFFDKEERL